MKKQTAKSPPSPAASNASDGDLVNRGIKKAKRRRFGWWLSLISTARRNSIQKMTRHIITVPKPNGSRTTTVGTIADYTKAIELGSTNPAAYNNRGNARAETKDRDGAIADYTRAIELKPDYARAYYNRAVLKKEKGDALGLPQISKGAKAGSGVSKRRIGSGFQQHRGANGEATEQRQFLDGKLKLDIPSDFSRDADDPKIQKPGQILRPDGAWGEVLRGTHGLTAGQARRLSENARGRIQQRLQLATQRFAPAMAEEKTS
jgi:tetratricopeptide (TPR) repeat protein